ncbi:MAG: penicillin-binding protein activator [Deltaproteobacteria bacterium]|nr:penicillin-binding protein activator [Deltaproteobacteria bacterium]
MKILLSLWMTAALFLCSCATFETPKPQATGANAPPAQLQKVWNDPDLLFKEAQKAYDESNYPLSLTALDRILASYPKSDVYGDAKKMADEIQSRLGLAGLKIGVLLPLTGSFSRFGDSALNGISCAIGLFDPCGSSTSKIQIVVKDTKGNAGTTAEALKELVEKEKVSAIIGPLTSVEAASATTQAQMLGVPVIVLAPQAGLTQAGDFIFQHTLLPETEVTALVNQLSKTDLKKFVIIYPKSKYGEEYKNLFAAQLQKSGIGKIIAEKSYAQDIPDFVGMLEQLSKEPAVEKILGGKKPDTLGIFIPDSYKQVAEMAQGLAALNIQGPKLIGTSRWYHPQLLAGASPALEGALFDTPFYPEANLEAARKFSGDFFKAYGNQPAWLEAFGYDSARLLMQAIASTGSEQPLSVRNGLLGIQSFPSVAGPLSWTEQRVSTWPPELITIRDGKFVPVQGP